MEIATKDEMQKMLKDAVSPLVKEIERLSKLIQPPAEGYHDYERGVEVAVKITGKSASTIYKLAASGLIPCRKIGGLLYFSARELNDWMANGKTNYLSALSD